MFCSNCGSKFENNARFCIGCGNSIENSKVNNSETMATIQETAASLEASSVIYGHSPTSYSLEKPYYQKKFLKFDQNNGSFQGSWNWAAFIFGVFWYLFKGMWVKSLLILIISVVTALIGVPLGFLLWIYCGIAANYDYYLLKKKRTQWW